MKNVLLCSIGIALVCMLTGAAVAADRRPIPLAADDDAHGAGEPGVWRGAGIEGRATTSLVTTVTAPDIRANHYAIIGEIRYDQVEGAGHLVMWNDFGDASYFTKTLEELGPLQLIRGGSEWRTFALPFAKSTPSSPDRLRVELILPDAGTVMIRSVALVSGRDWMSALNPNAWWSHSTVGVLGAVAGIALGCLGILIWLTRSRRAWRPVAWAATLIMVASGVIFLVVGIAALVDDQPGYVLHIPFLIGILATLVGAHSLWQLRQLRTENELRAIDAQSVGSNQ